MSRLLSVMQNHRVARYGLGCFTAAAVLLCLASCLILQSRHGNSLLQTANKIGPSAQSLVEGHGLAVCYGAGPKSGAANDSACVHAQRLPLAALTVAGLYLLFSPHTLPAALLKTLVFLLPALLAFTLAWRSVSTPARPATLGLFLLAFLLPPMLDTAVNLNFEEAYFYSWLALAVALLFFQDAWRAHPVRWAFTLWLSLTLTCLTKSSMLPATGFLALMATILVARTWRRPVLAAALSLACLCVPLAWGVYQHQTSGRFTVGTSLDGVNLYKGNNPGVLALYPAFRGASLDETEASLFMGNVPLAIDPGKSNDWAENDFALAQARSYIRSHPAETLQLDLRKASVFFLGVQRNLGEDPYPRLIELAFDLGLLLFRLLLLTALGFAIRNLFKPPAQRFPAIVFLGCVVCTAIPYVVGFALTRHSLVLILPTAAYLASLFAAPRDLYPRIASAHS